MRSEQVVAEAVRHRDSIFAVILAMVRDFNTAEDVLQETMVEIMHMGDRYDPQKPLLPWVKGIARNMVRRHWQRNARSGISFDDQTHLEYLADILDRQPEPDWHHEREALHHCLQTIGKKSRTLLEYRYLQGLQGTRLAEATGMALSSLANTYARLRRKLRDCVFQRLQEID